MLPVVLLQVVEATDPVDAALDFDTRRELAVEEVQDVAPRLLHVDDLSAAERAAIGGLSAAFGIEGGAVEQDGGPPSLVRDSNHARGEAHQIRIAQIQAVSHRMLRASGAPPVAGKAHSSVGAHCSGRGRAGQLRAEAGRTFEGSLIPFRATHSSKSKFFGTPRVMRRTSTRSGLKTLRRDTSRSSSPIPAMSVML